ASASLMKRNLLVSDLRTATGAAIRLGRGAQAEGLARRWLAQPLNRTSEGDPEGDRAFAGAVLAHAIALQGRLDEAGRALQPAMAWYRKEQAAGAHETTFRMEFAYALYVDAIAQPSTPSGTSQHNADLAEASAQIAGAS